MEAGAGAYEFNNWNHLALTCDGTVYSMYYNGDLIAQETFAEMDLDTNPLSMLIGCGYNKDGTGLFNGHAFKGRMDDVRIYDKALTAEQIKKKYGRNQRQYSAGSSQYLSCRRQSAERRRKTQHRI